jgi:hypothetical protein
VKKCAIIISLRIYGKLNRDFAFLAQILFKESEDLILKPASSIIGEQQC